MKEVSIVNIEKRAIKHLDSIRKEMGMSETQWGELAFPFAGDTRVKVSALKIPRTKGGEPLRLRLGEFCSLCHSLGRNPAQELLILWGDADTANK